MTRPDRPPAGTGERVLPHHGWPDRPAPAPILSVMAITRKRDPVRVDPSSYRV
ncbi:hypothetical protein GA0070216_10896 [Micromonospora matsumotoense]|uniref:Uncharacterized protein n=1 Tax=Micromonospora matsumotoense TaxID=121616 RepID=A0A1C4Z3R6_9ACTN|nr:hypothetical protein GA0070216_10896 [Micromonospora matsumotoense]